MGGMEFYTEQLILRLLIPVDRQEDTIGHSAVAKLQEDIYAAIFNLISTDFVGRIEELGIEAELDEWYQL